MSNSGKSFAVWMGLSFIAGILIGYKIKGLRIKYLQAKRKYLERKLAETRKKIDCESGAGETGTNAETGTGQTTSASVSGRRAQNHRQSTSASGVVITA